MSLLLKQRIFYDKQYGFEDNKSSTRALIDVTDQIYNTINNKKKYIDVFLDLRKAFDIITTSPKFNWKT